MGSISLNRTGYMGVLEFLDSFHLAGTCTKIYTESNKIIKTPKTLKTSLIITINVTIVVLVTGILGFHSCDETAMLVYKTMAKYCSSFA